MPQADDNLFAMRHSLAHIMATAIQELYPQTKFGIGPVVENGFYYDVDTEPRLAEEDLPKIEAKMKEIIKANYPFEHSTMSLDEAVAYFGDKRQTYKLDLLNDLKMHGTTVAGEIDRTIVSDDEAKVDEVGIYTDGPFTDLCRGPHVESTGKVGAFKLMRLSGAYWRGDDKNAQLQRLYGVGFTTKDELHKHLELLAEAEKRDHRKLGRELDLFILDERVGAGLPLFTPRGTVVYNAMLDFSRELNQKYGMQEVKTGHVTRDELYEVSGHLAKYGDDLLVAQAHDSRLALKPMNCPHHATLYLRMAPSYRDLPIRYAEYSTLHRNELTGTLAGLTRPRAFAQDDGHSYIRPDQIEAEIKAMLEQIKETFGVFGMDYKMRLSLRDPGKPEAYLGSDELWNKAESILRKLAEESGLDFFEEEGEAAFYGPKMDFMVADALGREWQVPTIQLDFNQAERFDLSYIDSDGSKQRPVVVHRAIQGSFERTMGVLIEHYAGAFPTWLAPEQVRLAPINDSTELAEFTESIRLKLASAGLRAGVDASIESVGKKIRSAGLAKVPYTIIVGEKERESGVVSPRLRTGHGEFEGTLSVDHFVVKLSQEVRERAPKSLL